MGEQIQLPDPEKCKRCQSDSKVIDSRPFPGYRYRRHECLSCGFRWPTYQMVISPHRITFKVRVNLPDQTSNHNM